MCSIKRIDFIKQMTGMVALPWVPVKKVTAHMQGPELYQRWIAGYSYYDGPTMGNRLSNGQSLQLRREPDNRHDGRAIEIYAGKYKLGLFPARITTSWLR